MSKMAKNAQKWPKPEKPEKTRKMPELRLRNALKCTQGRTSASCGHGGLTH